MIGKSDIFRPCDNPVSVLMIGILHIRIRRNVNKRLILPGEIDRAKKAPTGLRYRLSK